MYIAGKRANPSASPNSARLQQYHRSMPENKNAELKNTNIVKSFDYHFSVT